MSNYFKFVKIVRSDLPTLIEQWMLLIDSAEGLYSYLSIKSQSLVSNYVMAKEEIRQRPNNPHFDNSQQLAIHQAFLTKYLKGEKPANIVEDVAFLNQKYNTPIIRAFMQNGKVYVNSAGGWFPDYNFKFSVLELIETDRYEFPKEALVTGKPSINIIRWPQGKHFYAKVGETDVVIEGRQKWDTYEDAYKAAKMFIGKN